MTKHYIQQMKNMQGTMMKHHLLCNMFASIPELELAILIGSQVTGKTTAQSDWDIAIQWVHDLSFFEQLAASEKLRKDLSEVLGLPVRSIELIDLPTARLTMRAVVAEEGTVLKGDGSLSWHRFLQRTWRELEEYYWEQLYAA